MGKPWVPACLLPTFTWPHRVLGDAKLATSPPPTPRLACRTVRFMVGHVHSMLRYFSEYYCAWAGIDWDPWMVQLPFGLILKYTENVRLEEVAAMKIARAAGFPVPMVISYGEHKSQPGFPPVLVSILMTRVPGGTLGKLHNNLSLEQRQTVRNEMRSMLDVMRNWKHPWGDGRICSVMGSSIRSVRVPLHIIGPVESESEFNKDLIRVASRRSYPSPDAFEQALARAKKIDSMPHSIVFTHGDLKHHNILIHDGHVSGFIDWESAGWLPEYWDLTTAVRICPEDFWWVAFMEQAIGNRYLSEKDCERALMGLTSGSYAW